MDLTAIRRFKRLCLSSLIAVYILIAVGGTVRTTGSGMGCPDWPRCFGQWIPPTSVKQLPADYKATNAAFREMKNQKFIKYLRAVGLSSTADQLQNDPAIGTEEDFNATRTWIEYFNRLVGVVIGFFIIGMFWRSLPLRKRHPILFYISLGTLISVIIQGWFGSIVVSTNLTPWTITVHMFLALFIVALLVYLVRQSEDTRGVAVSGTTRWLLVACMFALLLQVFFGTEVRGMIDRLVAGSVAREGWIARLGVPFFIHRSLALLVVVLHVILWAKLRKTTLNNPLSGGLIVLILGALLTGLGMAAWSVPAVFQPAHLVLATGAFGLQLYLLFRMSTHLTEAQKV